MQIFHNKWTQEELNQWVDKLVDSQQKKILEALQEAAQEGQDVLRLCNLIREEMEAKNMVLFQSEANYKKFSSIFRGFQNGVIRWRLFKGNIT